MSDPAQRIAKLEHGPCSGIEPCTEQTHEDGNACRACNLERAIRTAHADLYADKRRLDQLEEWAKTYHVNMHGQCNGPDTGYCLLCWDDSDKVDEKGIPVSDGPMAENEPTFRAAIDKAVLGAAQRDGEKGE